MLVCPAQLLTDEAIRLRPLTPTDRNGFERLAADPSVRRFTRVPDPPPPGFVEAWLERYIDGWRTGALAGFAIELLPAKTWAGFVGIVAYNPEAAEGEIGYIVDAAARGHGVAVRALDLIAAWSLEHARLARVELMIDADNQASLKVAARCHFTHEGVLRNCYVKPGVRADVSVWSQIAASGASPDALT
jgi:ribosomal-protein-alanine N-acetyltransferase